jgi:hypothetical protein
LHRVRVHVRFVDRLFDFLSNLHYIQGLEQGRLSIDLTPCSSNGKVLNEEQYVDQPEELIDKPYSFMVNMIII